jgi:hypothetical protein
MIVICFLTDYLYVCGHTKHHPKTIIIIYGMAMYIFNIEWPIYMYLQNVPGDLAGVV